MRFRRNVAWMIVGQGVFAISQWAPLVVLARLGGPEEVGRFALALAVITPIVLFSRLQMRQIYIADPGSEHPFEDYFTVRVWTSVLALLIVAAVVLFGGFDVALASVALAVGLAKTFESLCDIMYSIAQRHERLDLVSQSMMIRGVLGAAALTGTFYVTESLTASVLALAMTWGGVWWLFDRRVSRPWQRHSHNSESVGASAARSWRRRATLAWLGLPLGVVLLLASLSTNLPRYVIETHLGSAEVGIFSALAYFSVAGNMVINAVGQAASPRLARYFAHRNVVAFRELLSKILAVAVGLGIAGVLVAVLLGRELLGLFYGADFARDPGLFVLMMVAALVGYAATPFGYAMTAMRMFRAQSAVFLAVVAVTAVGCLMLVPAYGLRGAALGWLGGLLCQLALGAWLNCRGLYAAARTGVSRPPLPTGVQPLG